MKINTILASILLNAAKLHEQAYDKAAAEVATKESEAKIANDPNNFYAAVVDYSKFYTRSLRESCIQAAQNAGQPELGEMVYYSLTHTWNDVLAWAEKNKADDKTTQDVNKRAEDLAAAYIENTKLSPASPEAYHLEEAIKFTLTKEPITFTVLTSPKPEVKGKKK